MLTSNETRSQIVIDPSSTPTQLDKIRAFLFPEGIVPVQNPYKDEDNRYLIGQGASVKSFVEFLNINGIQDSAAGNFTLFEGCIRVAENFDADETYIHSQMIYSMNSEIANYIRDIKGFVDGNYFLLSSNNGPIISDGNIAQPDISFVIMNNQDTPKFIVIECSYAVSMASKMAKIKELLTYPTVEFAILISARYPWNSTMDQTVNPPGLVYDINDGYLIFSVIPKPVEGAVCRATRVVSFGSHLSHVQKLRVAEYLNALVEIQGNRAPALETTLEIECDEHTQNENTFMYQFPDDLMMFFQHGNSILNGPIDANTPRLAIRMFDIKRALRDAVRLMNSLRFPVVTAPFRW